MMQKIINFNEMENNNGNHPVLAAFSSIVSLASASYCLIAASDVQPYFTLLGSIVAILSGIFAVRYYYFATKKVK
jgi:hypothetical protein